MKPCAVCAQSFLPSPRAAHAKYCGPACSKAAISRRYFELKANPERAKRAFAWNRMNWEKGILRLGSKPVETREAGSPDDVRQRLYCKWRPTCLDFAAGEGWDGFSCHECTVQESVGVDEAREDLPGLSRLLAEMDITTPFDQWKRRLCASRR